MAGDDQGDDPGTVPGQWLTVEAAARRLNVTPKAVRNRIKHGSLEWRAKGNAGREVFVPDAMEAAASRDDPEDDPGLVALMVENARLEERLLSRERELEVSREAERLSRERADRLEAELAEARRPLLVRILAALRR